MITKKNISFQNIKIPKVETAGITSRCTDLKHILMLDYDEIERWLVEEELKLLQHYHNLTPFYFFTTEEKINDVSKNLCGNYHAICVQKFRVQKISEIQDKTHIDWKYKGAFKFSRYKSWVLRSVEKGNRPKPKYLGIIGEKINLGNEVSEPHIKILKCLYDIDDIPYTNLDGLKETVLTSYRTASGV